jgi:hypothetical protein
MSIRVEVMDGGQIEIGWYDRKGSKSRQTYIGSSVYLAMVIFRECLNKEIEEERKSRFVSQQTIEARKAFRQLEEISPYGKK